MQTTTKPKLSALEFNSLYDFYNATNGPSWRWHNVSVNSREWDFSSPTVNPCFDNWQGLQCFCGLNSCSVSILLLNHHNLSGTLPNSLGNFRDMSQLILRGNNISGSITQTIGNLTQLLHLDLSSNHLGGEIPASIGRLSLLTELNLNDNRLTFIPEELYNLTNLRDLSIGYNDIHNPISSRIGRLYHVKVIYLRVNFFFSSIPPSIGNLTQLTSLDLSKTAITGSIPKELYLCRNLTTVTMRGNSLSGTIHPDIGNLHQLVSFDVDFNYMFGSIPSTIRTMSSLQALILNNNFFSKFIPSSIVECQRLRDLILEKNSFTGDASIITNMTAIESLYLGDNFFSEEFHIYSPTVFTNLIYFDLSSNSFVGPVPWGEENWGRLLLVYDVNTNYFSGELPFDYSDAHLLLYFVVENNHLWGTVPATFLQQDNATYFVDLATNYFSGALPAFLGNKTALSQVLLYENEFTGKIPNAFSELRRLVVFDVSYNLLTGRVPPLLQELHLLEEFFVESNQLTGQLRDLLNVNKTVKLVNVDVSDNQFTGEIPSEIFLNVPSLQSFAASKNCLEGSIPTELCLVPGLSSLSLDGVTTSNKCKQLIFGNIPYFDGFIATHYLKGTIPSCLFEIPSLQLLHISGNSFTGTIPSGLNLPHDLTDLSLSHNSLSGSIPVEIQETPWLNLDLSYNKLSGTLISTFPAIPPNGQLNLEVNRLSGNIPSALLKSLNVSSQSINLLNGNIFACDILHTNLPDNDPNYETYSCGSDSVNDVLYAWIASIVLFPLLLLLTARFCGKIFQFSRDRVSSIFEKLKIWRNALIDRPERVHTQRLSMYFKEMRLASTYLTIYIVLLIPIYSVLKLPSASYSVEYVWSISGLLNSGKAAAIVTFIVLFLLALVYFFLLRRITGLINQRVSPTGRKSSQHENDKIPKLYRLIVYSIVCITNVVIMGIVDFSYVYIVLNYDPVVVALAALALALYRLLTNHILRWVILPATYDLVGYWCFEDQRSSSVSISSSSSSRRRLVDPDCYSTSDNSLLENLVLFNNIVIPVFAIIFTLPDCFYNALFAAAAVQSSYYYSSCFQYVAVISYGHVCSVFTETTQYSPPFIYSYQCSSKIVANYVPVYILLFILSGVVIPSLKLGLKIAYDSLNKKSVQSMTYAQFIIQNIVPEYFRELHRDGDADISRRKKLRLFSKLTLTVQINSSLTIMMCFGALFPPLALIAAITIYSVTYFEELSIGWLLTQTRALGEGYRWYEEQIERECEGVEKSGKLTMWSTLIVSSCLYAYVIFDTMGDKMGWAGALPLTLTMTSLPLLCYGGLRVYRRWTKTKTLSTTEDEGECDDSGVVIEEVKGVMEVVEVVEEKGAVRTLSTIELPTIVTNPLLLSDVNR